MPISSTVVCKLNKLKTEVYSDSYCMQIINIYARKVMGRGSETQI